MLERRKVVSKRHSAEPGGCTQLQKTEKVNEWQLWYDYTIHEWLKNHSGNMAPTILYRASRCQQRKVEKRFMYWRLVNLDQCLIVSWKWYINWWVFMCLCFFYF